LSSKHQVLQHFAQCAVEDVVPPFCVRLVKHEDGWPESELIVLRSVEVARTNVTAKLRRNAKMATKYETNISVPVNWISSFLSPFGDFRLYTSSPSVQEINVLGPDPAAHTNHHKSPLIHWLNLFYVWIKPIKYLHALSRFCCFLSTSSVARSRASVLHPRNGINL
jgi:hypothetical protein